MRVLAALILLLAAGVPAMACGVDSDCELGERSYRIYLPERKAREPLGAIIFAHGYRGTASQVLGDRSLTGLANELHVALVAPQAVDGDWQLPNRPRQKDTDGATDLDYFRRLIDDIGKRFGIDRRKLYRLCDNYAIEYKLYRGGQTQRDDEDDDDRDDE